jgi:hypothetical protein
MGVDHSSRDQFQRKHYAHNLSKFYLISEKIKVDLIKFDPVYKKRASLNLVVIVKNYIILGRTHLKRIGKNCTILNKREKGYTVLTDILFLQFYYINTFLSITFLKLQMIKYM